MSKVFIVVHYFDDAYNIGVTGFATYGLALEHAKRIMESSLTMIKAYEDTDVSEVTKLIAAGDIEDALDEYCGVCDEVLEVREVEING